MGTPLFCVYLGLDCDLRETMPSTNYWVHPDYEPERPYALAALGARSGYEIRRAAELSVRFFWALGPPQIYAELSALEKAGLIGGQDDSRGRRPRRRYTLRSKGRSALAQWVRSHRDAPLELRDPLLLRLFFADVVDPADGIALLRRIRDRSIQALATFDEHILPAAPAPKTRASGSPRWWPNSGWLCTASSSTGARRDWPIGNVDPPRTGWPLAGGAR
jgi:DNA-binding PadR family transcriptional regulator